MKTFLQAIVVLFCVNLMAQSDIAVVGSLPAQISETSGLIFYNNKLITHNDSDNLAELYELDPTTLAITRTISITNATNIDWEDISQDESYIYIGDIGNNNGDRQDLSILKISKSDFDSGTSVTAEQINFLYENQTNFETTTNSDFDAEGLFVLNDQLIILTKQWQQLGTVAYSVPKVPGAYLAEELDAFQVDGLVTGATYDAFTKQLYLVGYSQFLTPFFVHLTNIDTNSLFNGTITKTNLAIGQAQVEAITFTNDGLLYISSEEYNNPPLINTSSRLFVFRLDADAAEEEEEEEEGLEEGGIPIESAQNGELVVFKTFDSQYLNYRLNTNHTVIGMGIFDSTGRLITTTPLENLTSSPIDLSSLTPSMYYLSFFLVDGVISAPFLKN